MGCRLCNWSVCTWPGTAPSTVSDVSVRAARKMPATVTSNVTWILITELWAFLTSLYLSHQVWGRSQGLHSNSLWFFNDRWLVIGVTAHFFVSVIIDFLPIHVHLYAWIGFQSQENGREVRSTDKRPLTESRFKRSHYTIKIGFDFREESRLFRKRNSSTPARLMGKGKDTNCILSEMP